MTTTAWDRVPIAAQTIEATLSQFATFLVLEIGPGDDDLATVRDTISGIDDLLKTVGFRDLSARLSCVVGIGSEAWDRLSPGHRPQLLRKFPRIDAGKNVAPSTPGDLLLHVRAERSDLCFEFVRVVMNAPAAASPWSTRRPRSATSTPVTCSASSTAPPTPSGPS